MNFTVVSVEGCCCLSEDLASLLRRDEEGAGLLGNTEVAVLGQGIECSMRGADGVLCPGLQHPAFAEVTPNHFTAAHLQDLEMVSWGGVVIIKMCLTIHPLVTNIALPPIGTRKYNRHAKHGGISAARARAKHTRAQMRADT